MQVIRVGMQQPWDLLLLRTLKLDLEKENGTESRY